MPTAHTDDGIKISYQAFGEGPRNLLFLHGWGGSGAYWDEMLQQMDLIGLRAITPSYRGHGDSDKPATGYTLERFARDIFAVADHAGANTFVLVGFSMSGKFAQYMTVTQPERVRGLVLVAPAAASALSFPAELARTWCDAAGRRDLIREILAPFIRIPIKGELMDAFVEDFVKIPRVALEETVNMFSKISFIERVKEIRAPTLVLGGAHDPILTPDYLRQEVIGHIPRARLVILPCGHEIPQEMPAETAALLTAFLAGLR